MTDLTAEIMETLIQLQLSPPGDEGALAKAVRRMTGVVRKINKPKNICFFRMDLDAKEHSMRLSFAESAQSASLGHIEFNAESAYDFANMILSGYDKLEGIK